MEFFCQKAKYTFPLYFWSKGAVSDFQQSLLRRSISSQASTKKQRVRNNNISPEEAITSILTKHPKNPYQGSWNRVVTQLQNAAEDLRSDIEHVWRQWCEFSFF